jgi:hypothetical protein
VISGKILGLTIGEASGFKLDKEGTREDVFAHSSAEEGEVVGFSLRQKAFTVRAVLNH